MLACAGSEPRHAIYRGTQAECGSLQYDRVGQGNAGRFSGGGTMVRSRRKEALCILLVSATTLVAGCNLQRDDLNPIRIFCPGTFDPETNKCVVDTDTPLGGP